MSPPPTTPNAPPPPVVALASWLLPGLGYLLLGQRKRAFTVGVTILLLLLLGLLIGGVRVMEVPGYGDDGRPVMLDSYGRHTSHPGASAVWALRATPMAELRDKPWSIPQVLTGPAALGSMAWSVWAARPEDGSLTSAEPRAATSHSRVNEIGVLYTAVAGMLNLLAIIDAASRAEQRRSASST
jgi:hypothetical protein